MLASKKSAIISEKKEQQRTKGAVVYRREGDEELQGEYGRDMYSLHSSLSMAA